MLKYMSHVMRKPVFCICERRGADQLRGNSAADQHLHYRYRDSTILLLPKSEISSLCLSSVAVQPGLCRTMSETTKTGFLMIQLICQVNFSNSSHEPHCEKTCLWGFQTQSDINKSQQAQGFRLEA